MDGELKDNVIPVAYSPDIQRWTVIVNGNKYDFFGVNPYIKRKLGSFIKHNNKGEFFKLLRSLDYERWNKPKKQNTDSEEKKDKNGGEPGEQLSMFDENKTRESIKEELRKV